MKLAKSILLTISFLAVALTFTACSGNSSESDSGKKTTKEYTSAYVCPMHCEGSGSDKEGTCPACGMDYVKNEDHKKDGHTH